MTDPMPRSPTLTDRDHANAEAFVGAVLEAYADGTLSKAAAVEEVMQALAEVDTARYGEARYRFEHGRTRWQGGASSSAASAPAAARMVPPAPATAADDFALSQNETFVELQAANNEPRLNEIVNIARKTVAAGGKFELIETYNGIRHDVLAVYTTSADVEGWVTELNKLRAAIGQTKLG